MGQIQIEVFEFALLVDHQDGITVVFPEIDHSLMVRQNGRITPIMRGGDLVLCGPGGATLPGAAVEMTNDYKNLVVDIKAALAANVAVPPALIDPATPSQRTTVNGRLFLKGGKITARECSIPANRTQFTFPGGNFFVTDTAVFTLQIPDNETFELSVNQQAALSLPDGSVTRIMNSDALGCAPRPFETLDEFVALCRVLGQNPPTPTIAGDPIRPMGGIPICTIARISAP
jgi:hypothetical protein